MKKCGAEFIGTFALVFAGTGAIVINETSGGAITQVGIALTFGLIVLAMIYTVGDHSRRTLKSSGQFGFFYSSTLSVALKWFPTFSVSVRVHSRLVAYCGFCFQKTRHWGRRYPLVR